MRFRVLTSLLFAAVIAPTLFGQAVPDKQKFSPPSRKFRFTYSFTVKDIPAGTKIVRVWMPVAHSDEHQTVRLVTVKAPVDRRGVTGGRRVRKPHPLRRNQ